MKAGEQISVMGDDGGVHRPPLAPRFWAGVITMPLLALFSAMGIIGGWVVGVLMIGVDGGSFWEPDPGCGSMSGPTSATA